uniref:Uncharacterized protein n=1 Tax=Cucumis sativus TaxID=3659 RepID=A0A0A0K2G4_CUCSA
MPQVDFASKLSKPVGTFSQRIVSDLPPPRKWRIQKFKRHHIGEAGRSPDNSC